MWVNRCYRRAKISVAWIDCLLKLSQLRAIPVRFMPYSDDCNDLILMFVRCAFRAGWSRSDRKVFFIYFRGIFKSFGFKNIEENNALRGLLLFDNNVRYQTTAKFGSNCERSAEIPKSGWLFYKKKNSLGLRAAFTHIVCADLQCFFKNHKTAQLPSKLNKKQMESVLPVDHRSQTCTITYGVPNGSLFILVDLSFYWKILRQR